MAITAAQIEILNTRLGNWARKVGLGTLIDNAEKAIVTGVGVGEITAGKLGAAAVETAKIKAKNVTTACIADEAVTAGQLPDKVIVTAKIDDLAVTAAQLAADAVTTAKILNLNVTAGKIAADAVTTAKILDANVTEPKLAAVSSTTLGVKRILLGVFDATAGKALGTYAIACAIPDNAILQRLDYEVTTTFTSAGADAGTIALQLQAGDDLIAAVAISDGANPWDAAVPKVTKVTGATSTWIKTTAARQVSAVVAEQALTAGVLRVYGEFVQSI